MAELQVDVVAADQTIWSGSARSVVVPAVGGELGVLVGHEPLMAVLGTGQVRVTPSAEKEALVSQQIVGGFVSVDEDNVTIVIDTVVDTEA
ncbi:MAG TPA: F0F1 ATP synthase subunit epsilon [Actinomycetales bacterium]|nr:F0F1 ATP synthase subunit epsilon [Actinomycetales bacterium]